MKQRIQKYQGLTTRDAESRFLLHGDNIVASGNKKSGLLIFAGQFRDLLVLVLLAATGISALLGETAQAITIILIVIVNALLGFFHEMKTERTLQALLELSIASARVIRDGQPLNILASEVVMGDILLLEAGDCVAADGKVLEHTSLSCDESLLTGDPNPKMKRNTTENIGNIAEAQSAMVFLGSHVATGSAVVEVTDTGMRTQLGVVASMIEGGKEPRQSPLQRILHSVGQTIGISCVAVCALLGTIGVLRAEEPIQMFITAISLAVAVIPEGLPAIVTISLAMSVRRILSKEALVKELHAVETLGCATVVCTDKTGTLTQNKMAVNRISTLSDDFELSDTQSLSLDNSALQSKPMIKLLEACCHCNNATIEKRKGIPFSRKIVEVEGEATEKALLEMAYKSGINPSDFTRIEEKPFDSVRKRMSVFGIFYDGTNMMFAKGAPEILLARCSFICTEEGVKPLTHSIKKEMLLKGDKLATDALRVLGFAYKETSISNALEEDMVFSGLLGLYDPPREEAREAVRACRRAKIRPVMITGDHVTTAKAIASMLDISRKDDLILTGNELDRMDDEKLKIASRKASVYARVTPMHKLRILKALKATGEITAMTGDGINDAPALKEADIGVAMGESGTDVTRAVAEVILLDDNFATLVHAIEEGRVIFHNIKRFLRYILACNLGEVITLFTALLMGMPAVLLPIQLLLVNLVTDGLPAIALGLEPTNPSVMKQPPRAQDKSIFIGGLKGAIVTRGIFIAITTLACFTILLRMDAGIEVARTGALIALIGTQLIHIFECRGDLEGNNKPPLFSNPALILAVFTSILATAIAVYYPPAQLFFKTTPLPLNQLAVALLCSISASALSYPFTKAGNNRKSTKFPSITQ